MGNENTMRMGNVKFNQTLPGANWGTTNSNAKPENIKFSDDGNYNRQNVVQYNNGITITFPQQGENSEASIMSYPGRYPGAHEEDNKIVLTNVKGATIFCSDSADLIELNGCQDCTVNSSKPDLNRDYIVIQDSDKQLSKGNTVLLSEDRAGDGVCADFVNISHDYRHFVEYEKYYRGASGRPRPQNNDDVSYGVTLVQEGEIVPGVQTLKQQFLNWLGL